MAGIRKVPGELQEIPIQEMAVKLKKNIIKIVKEFSIPLPEAKKINTISNDQIRSFSDEDPALAQCIVQLRDAVLAIYQHPEYMALTRFRSKQRELVDSIRESINAFDVNQEGVAKTVLVHSQTLMNEFMKASSQSKRVMAADIRTLKSLLTAEKQEREVITKRILDEIEKLNARLMKIESTIQQSASPKDQKETKYPGTVWRRKG